MTLKSALTIVGLASFIATAQTSIPPNKVTELKNAPKTSGGPFIITHADVPLYPTLARIAHQNGAVRVRVSVEAGAVTSLEAESSAPMLLVNASKENVRT
jgi:outer membrane biosynthesis protein TonB